jgi:hypothetical protein
MRIEYTFDNDKLKEMGYTLNQVYDSVKGYYAEHNLPCVSDNEVLAFEGTGHKDDYSYMLILMGRIARSGWFINSATSCTWYESNRREHLLDEMRADYFKENRKRA